MTGYGQEGEIGGDCGARVPLCVCVWVGVRGCACVPRAVLGGPRVVTGGVGGVQGVLRVSVCGCGCGSLRLVPFVQWAREVCCSFMGVVPPSVPPDCPVSLILGFPELFVVLA